LHYDPHLTDGDFDKLHKLSVYHFIVYRQL